MFRFIFRIGFLLLLIFGGKYAVMQTIDCRSGAQNAEISVQLEIPDPKLNTSLSFAQMTRKFDRHHDRQTSGGQDLALGLTEAKWQAQSQIGFSEVAKGLAGESCLMPGKVNVVVHLKQTIYMGKTAAKSKCQMEALMDHEMKHVAVNKGLTEKYVPKLEKLVREGLMAFSQQQGSDLYETSESAEKKEQMQDYIMRPVNRAMENMQEIANGLHEKIDTTEEYERIGRLCEW
jgi:hypothetical protein